MDEFSKQWSLMGKDSNNLAKIRKFFKNMELPITTQFAKGHDGRQQEESGQSGELRGLIQKTKALTWRNFPGQQNKPEN